MFRLLYGEMLPWSRPQSGLIFLNSENPGGALCARDPKVAATPDLTLLIPLEISKGMNG